MASKQENKIVNDQAVIIWKRVGETPLEALERFRAEQVEVGRMELANVPMTYAGRLDPLAEGELLILIGEECKNKDLYLGLDKEYEVEIVFGIETDTYDSLGIATLRDDHTFDLGDVGREGEHILSVVEAVVTKKVVTFNQEYPPYSSRTVNGRQLHELARAGELPDEMPRKEVTIYSIELLGHRKISAEYLKKEIIQKIDLVKGDFRQDEIKKRWEAVLKQAEQSNKDRYFEAVRIFVKCSSGTYMRVLAHELGKKAGTGAFALAIKRSAICT